MLKSYIDKMDKLEAELNSRINKIIDIIQKGLECDYIPSEELIGKDFRDFLKDRNKFISYEIARGSMVILFFAKNPKPYYVCLTINNLFEGSIRKIVKMAHTISRQFKIVYDKSINDEN